MQETVTIYRKFINFESDNILFSGNHICVQVGSTLHTYEPVCVKDASKTASWHMGFLSERNKNGYY